MSRITEAPWNLTQLAEPSLGCGSPPGRLFRRKCNHICLWNCRYGFDSVTFGGVAAGWPSPTWAYFRCCDFGDTAQQVRGCFEKSSVPRHFLRTLRRSRFDFVRSTSSLFSSGCACARSRSPTSRDAPDAAESYLRLVPVHLHFFHQRRQNEGAWKRLEVRQNRALVELEHWSYPATSTQRYLSTITDDPPGDRRDPITSGN